MHDIVHSLIFFAARRDSALEPNSIRSLTQPFVLDADFARVLLDGYQEIGRLVDVEWEAMPWIVRSQWCSSVCGAVEKCRASSGCRTYGIGIGEVVDWLDRSAEAFFERLRVS